MDRDWIQEYRESFQCVTLTHYFKWTLDNYEMNRAKVSMAVKMSLICATNRGSYARGHFIWHLWNSPKARFINFRWNDHECKILFITWPLKWDFIVFRMKIISIRKRIVGTEINNDVTRTHQSVITRVIIQFIWHDVIQWITVTSCDKRKYEILAGVPNSGY